MSAIPATTSTKRTWWLSPAGALLAFALVSGAAAWWLIAAPVVSLARVPAHGEHFAWTWMHMLSGTLMLFGGALNLYVGATRRAFRWHRAIGFAKLGSGAAATWLTWIVPLLLCEVALQWRHGAPVRSAQRAQVH